MLATDRDRQIVLTIGRFRQLTSGQIRELLFHDAASPTPMKRALSRLMLNKFIVRIERRLIGGTGAGSGQYVYQLGTRGWQLCGREGRYWPFRAVDYHMLAIADAYVELRQLERAGILSVTTYETEPDTWREIAGASLTPDLYVELSIPSRRQILSLWLEVDTGTERQKQIKEKLARYWHAYQHAEGLDVFPAVMFVVPDDQRAYDVRRWIASGPEEARQLFGVVKQGELAKLFL